MKKTKEIAVVTEWSILIVSIVGLGFAWDAWRQRQRGDLLERKYLDAVDTFMDLEDELKHSQDLAWNRLSDAQKDAAIRMG
jgi:hypothetical protein